MPKIVTRWEELALEAGKVFTPNTPIDERSLFSGRMSQVRRVVDVVNQKGQHAIIYGERGVGKTSLANVLSQYLSRPGFSVLAPRVNCDGGDNFGRIWNKVFDQITLTSRVPSIGFTGGEAIETSSSRALLGRGTPTPDSVRRALTTLSEQALPTLIIDECDRH